MQRREWGTQVVTRPDGVSPPECWHTSPGHTTVGGRTSNAEASPALHGYREPIAGRLVSRTRKLGGASRFSRCASAAPRAPPDTHPPPAGLGRAKTKSAEELDNKNRHAAATALRIAMITSANERAPNGRRTPRISVRCPPKSERAECPASVSRGAEARALVSFIRLFAAPSQAHTTSREGIDGDQLPARSARGRQGHTASSDRYSDRFPRSAEEPVSG
jgi:hypothetical protein